MIEEMMIALAVWDENRRVMRGDEETIGLLTSIQSKCLLLTTMGFKMILEVVLAREVQEMFPVYNQSISACSILRNLMRRI